MAATGFTPRQVTAGSGGTGRFVVTGRDRLGHVVAYTSTDNGATWAQSEGFGVVPSAWAWRGDVPFLAHPGPRITVIR
jgi:hypothetical protein